MYARDAKIAQKSQNNRRSLIPKILGSDSTKSTYSSIDQNLFLQRSIGNQAVQRLYKSGVLQTKLKIGQPNDDYEQEADLLTEQVMRIPESKVHRKELEEKDELALRGKHTTSESIAQLQNNGDEAETLTGMPNQLKTGLEHLSGMDLSGTRVHRNSSKPAQLNAVAFTQGQDIHVGPGQEKHLPHEGWHAVQQMQGRVQPTMQAKGVSINDDAGLEREADVKGAKALQLGHSDQDTVDLAYRASEKSSQVIQKEEPIPKTAKEVVAGGEEEVKYEAARIQDKYARLMIYYAGALQNFTATLEAPSSKDVKPQVGKALVAYAEGKVIGEIASKIPGASYVYDIYKEIQKETARAAKAGTMRDVSEFFKTLNKRIVNKYGDLEGRETELVREARDYYRSLPNEDKKTKYWLTLRLKADELERHSKEMTQDRIFQILSAKWIAETTKTARTVLKAYIEIKLDKTWKVTRAHIHAPGGQKIADEFNQMTDSVNPLALEARKVVYAEGYTLKNAVSGRDFLFQTHLSPSNNYTGDNKKLYDAVKTKGIPTPSKWTGN